MLDFTEYIHDIRRKGIEKIEPYLRKKKLNAGLEVGAGDGYQSRILVNYLNKLVVTEFSSERLQQIPNDKIQYQICDAECIEEYFSYQSFDLIFSSHLLEHLPNSSKLLQSCSRLIAENGLIIHTVPSNWYALFRVLFWYPSIVSRFFKKKRTGKQYLNLLKHPENIKSNNLKKNFVPRIRILEILLPRPHGISSGLIKEYLSMRKKSWSRMFQSNNLSIVEVIDGSCFSGYGFGFERSKKFLSRLGVACEFIYILKKNGND